MDRIRPDVDTAAQEVVTATTDASDAQDPAGGHDAPAAKQDISVVSAADAGGGKAPGGSAVARKPRPDALLLSFAEYKPVEHACWEAGQPTPYLHLAQAFQVRCFSLLKPVIRAAPVQLPNGQQPFSHVQHNTRLVADPAVDFYRVYSPCVATWLSACLPSPVLHLAVAAGYTTRRADPVKRCQYHLVVSSAAGDGGHKEAPHH